MGSGGGGDVVGKVGKQIKRTKVKDAITFNPLGEAADVIDRSGNLRKVTEAGQAIKNVGGFVARETAGQAGATFVDKPAEAKKAARAASEASDREQQAILKSAKEQEDQEAAEDDATKARGRARTRQRRRSSGTGRASTILTEDAGSTTTGGGGRKKKTLLGV